MGSDGFLEEKIRSCRREENGESEEKKGNNLADKFTDKTVVEVARVRVVVEERKPQCGQNHEARHKKNETLP